MNPAKLLSDRLASGNTKITPAKIVHVGEPVLRHQARPLTPEEIRSSQIQELIAVMRETMYSAPGVGLAAPQIGLGLQLAVIEDKPEYTKEAGHDFLTERERRPVPFQVIANPQIIKRSEVKREFFEGCLSLPGFTAVVPRALEVTVEALDDRGEPTVIEASGWYARILQHEIDHLNGAVYIDRMRSRSFMTLANFDNHYKSRSMAEVRQLINWD